MSISDKQWVGAETSEVKRDKPLPNIGPGKIEYGHGERIINYRDAGGNLPFTQKIQNDDEG